MSIYGSFLYGTFHLDTTSWRSYSDVDCVCAHAFDDEAAAAIEDEIRKCTGLNLKVSIRANLNHVKALPKRVSDAATYVETALNIMREGHDPRYRAYSLCKYVLRTAFFHVAIHDFIPDPHLNGSADEVYELLWRNKLFGDLPSSQDWTEILDYCGLNDRDAYHGLDELMTGGTRETLLLRWNEFREEIAAAGFVELHDDLCRKVLAGTRAT